MAVYRICILLTLHVKYADYSCACLHTTVSTVYQIATCFWYTMSRMFCFTYALQPMLGLVHGTLSGSVNNGRITCRFQRLRNVAQTSSKRSRSAQQAASDVVWSLDDTEYYILMAKGQAFRG